MSRDEATKYKNEGNAAFKKKQWNEAIAAYTKAAETDPSWEVPYSNRSQVYVEFHFFSFCPIVRFFKFYLTLFIIKHSRCNIHTNTQ